MTMKHPFRLLLALIGLLAPSIALAHPHIWISQQVRVITKDGRITNNWSGRTTEYRRRTRAAKPDDFEFA